MVDWNINRCSRPGPCGDDDCIGSEGLFHAVDREHFNLAVGEELGSAVEQCHAIPRQLFHHVVAV